MAGETGVVLMSLRPTADVPISTSLPASTDGIDVDQNDNVYALSGPTGQSTYQISVFSDTQSGNATPLSVTTFTLPADTTPPVSDGIAGPALDGNGNAYVLGLRPGLNCTIYRVPLGGGTVSPVPAVDCASFINPFRSQLRGFHSDGQGRVYVGFNNHVGPGNPGPSIIYRLTPNADGTLTKESSTGFASYEIRDLAITPAGNVDALVEFGRVLVVAGSSFTSGSWNVIDNYDAVAFNTLKPPLVVDHAGNLFVVGASAAAAGFTFADARANYYLVWGVALVVFVLLANVLRSDFGRALRAIRTDQTAALALGIDVPRYKLYAFLISAACASVAGSLYAYYFQFLSPDMVSTPRSLEYVTMLVIGGEGSLAGPLLGVLLIVLLPTLFASFYASYRDVFGYDAAP